MVFRVLIRRQGKWQPIGLDHMSAADACSEARNLCEGYRFLVVAV